ncbi:Endoplasmic reticulum mannosyl-oligosaccharide 1,2-alpha-mannosidase [Cladobotryum mycophilum]|uniref:alpha-1,2-Mannosidase n=1 Tax=Cladobotryum mycophilum TaxID=491253 RepID=A0ABR0SKH5_9HYPO
MVLSRRRIVVISLTIITALALWQSFGQKIYRAPRDTAAGEGSRSQAPADGFIWRNIQDRYPVTSFRPLPKPSGDALPKVQAEFPPESAADKKTRLTRQKTIKDAFVRCWETYKKYAWLRDEVAPISGQSKETFGGWGATLIDSLDTLWIMDMKDEFGVAVEAVDQNVSFAKTEAVWINIFETTIRFLGGLLAAYDLSGDERLLLKAKDVGDMLYKAFDTPNHLPVTRWYFHAASRNEKQSAPYTALVAEVGSLCMEFTRLSLLTGDPKYYDATQHITELFQASQKKTKLPGMWPIAIDTKNKKFDKGADFTLGGMADSMYEYLAKMVALLGDRDSIYRSMYLDSIETAKKYLFYRPMIPEAEDILFSGNLHVYTSGPYKQTSTGHLTCFVGGMLALGGKIMAKPAHIELGNKITRGCIWAYEAMKTGVMPETFNMVTCDDATPCAWNETKWHQDIRDEQNIEDAEAAIKAQNLPKGFTRIPDTRYILRPEAIESVFIMYRVTGDPYWQEKAWRMWQSVDKLTRTELAYSAVLNVNVNLAEGRMPAKPTRWRVSGWGGNIRPHGLDIQPLYAGIAATIIGGICISSLIALRGNRGNKDAPGLLKSFFLFFYSCFIKPHQGDSKASQQDALESFYKKQAGVYDATRKVLLRGREDMLALVAAQLGSKAQLLTSPSKTKTKRIWVDIGGGTGWNIEAMSQFVDVPTFFTSVYLVDFSPSLCEVARKRFERLGWNNVTVVCQDARKFRLEDYEADMPAPQNPLRSPVLSYFTQQRQEHGGADLVTFSYSLSMIPDYYSVVDSVTSLLSPDGILGVVDFYVQNQIDFSFRNYTGGFMDRHVNALSRMFWRAWFDFDRVGLEPGRRDYLEYKFGTVLNFNHRNRALGYIPYYVWVGCPKKPFSPSSLPHEILERIDALATESPYLYPVNQGDALTRAIERSAPEIRSKAFITAVRNLSANLPLPSFFYQNHHWRIYYDDGLQKHTQFNDEYIYAFTWEDARVDERLLKLGPDDKVLAISSAGDNILAYLAQSPARVHAVDLNPTQNHLLELKAAAYTSLPYEDFWKIFGDGKHPEFRKLLISKLSPHLSGRAFQYWLKNVHVFQNNKGYGLYDTGGSRHAIRVFRWVARIFGLQSTVKKFLEAKTLNEQREIWRTKIRPALLSKFICNLVVSQESFLWAALGVPKNQLAMIERDHAESDLVKEGGAKNTRSHAIWHYMVNTLDPVAEETSVGTDNPYYYVTMAGKFSRKCPPEYLRPETHAKLSRPNALDGLRIHTDELEEVIARITPGSLTVVVIMDSMDWFDNGSYAAAAQISKLNRALQMGGRVLLRSSALAPWYVKVFEAHGFTAKRHGARLDGACIDRVNMYASCWICTKTENLPPPTPEMDRIGITDITSLTI